MTEKPAQNALEDGGYEQSLVVVLGSVHKVESLAGDDQV